MRLTHINRIVSEHFGITSQSLQTEDIEPNILPRYIAMHFMKKLAGHTHKAIDEFYSKKGRLKQRTQYAAKYVEDRLNHPDEVKLQIIMARLEKQIVGSWELQKLSLEGLKSGK